MNYVTTSGLRDGFRWDWKHRGNEAWGGQVAISTLPDMTTALKQNPNLKIMILNGYFDLATIFYGVEHSVNHMDLPEQLRNNIIMKYYEAGHMMYTHKPSMEKFREDVSTFISETSN
jgi:carboxypeptidase C (cathepsin A)